MPDRILRQGIRKSRATAANILDGGWIAGVFFDWLLTVVDDFGRYEADSELLRVEMFPFLLDTVRSSHVDRCLASCEAACLIRRYETNGKHFLVVMKVDRPRAKRSRFPQPPAGIECWRGFGDRAQVFTTDLRTEADTCAQTRANVPYSYSYSDAHSDSVSEAKKGRLNAKKADSPSSKPPKTPKPRDGTDPDLDAMHGLPPIPSKLDTPKFRTAWQEWVQHCAQRNGHPITPLSARKLLQRLSDEMEPDRAAAAIDFSIGNNYAGVVEPRDSKQDRPDKRASQRMTSNVIVD